MKHSLLIIILSFLLLSSPVIGNNHKGETLYRWGEYPDFKWMGFGDKDTHPVYKGQVKNGKPNGLGVSIFPSGGKYVGSWKNGMRNEKGTYTNQSGDIHVGEWKNDILWNGKGYYKDGTIIYKKVNGRETRQWTKQLGTSSDDEGNGVTTDSSGNIYVTGTTRGGLDGNTNMGGECENMWSKKVLCSDIFLVKYNSSGTKQWTKQLGTFSNDEGNGVTTDSSGNIYVTGSTGGGFDGYTNSGYDDIFLVKYNSSGTKQWTKQLGTHSYESGSGVTTDSSGNIYVTGSTGGGLDGNTSSSSYNHDIFLVKYNSSGTKQWTKQLGSSESDSGSGVTTDSSGNIYVTGYTGGGLDGNTFSGGHTDIFLVKYDSSGTKQWTKQLGTSSFDSGNDVTTDSSGNIYVTGKTSGSLDGNTDPGGDWNDIILVKYDSSGTRQWIKQLGSSLNDWGDGVTTDSSGNIYITGFTHGYLDGNTNSGWSDIFLVKYNSSGSKQWTKQLGTSKDERGLGVTTDSSENIYVTGNTDGGLDGNKNMGGECVSPYNSDNKKIPCSDIFLVKYNSSGIKQ